MFANYSGLTFIYLGSEIMLNVKQLTVYLYFAFHSLMQMILKF